MLQQKAARSGVLRLFWDVAWDPWSLTLRPRQPVESSPCPELERKGINGFFTFEILSVVCLVFPPTVNRFSLIFSDKGGLSVGFINEEAKKLRTSMPCSLESSSASPSESQSFGKFSPSTATAFVQAISCSTSTPAETLN